MPAMLCDEMEMEKQTLKTLESSELRRGTSRSLDDLSAEQRTAKTPPTSSLEVWGNHRMAQPNPRSAEDDRLAWIWKWTPKR